MRLNPGPGTGPSSFLGKKHWQKPDHVFQYPAPETLAQGVWQRRAPSVHKNLSAAPGPAFTTPWIQYLGLFSTPTTSPAPSPAQRPLNRAAATAGPSPGPPGRISRPSGRWCSTRNISNRGLEHRLQSRRVPHSPFRSWPCPTALEPALPEKCSPGQPENRRNRPVSATNPPSCPIPVQVRIAVHIYDVTAGPGPRRPHEVVQA